MPLNVIADFFDMINTPLFDTATVVLILSFIVWEIPRSIKLIDEEYTKGLYPDQGRVVDIALFVIGLLTVGFYLMDDNANNYVKFLHTPGITSLFLILMVTVPLIILLGYFKRLFARLDSHNSIAVFVVHGFLDLMHTLFFIALSIMVIPAAGLLLIGLPP